MPRGLNQHDFYATLRLNPCLYRKVSLWGLLNMHGKDLKEGLVE